MPTAHQQQADVAVFVLNLPRDTHRRALVTQELARAGLTGTFVDGVEAASLTAEDWARYDGRRCRAIYGVDMLPAELGCVLAHERVLRRIVDEDIDVALVLEDDVLLDVALPRILHDLLAVPRTWMMVRLGSLRGRKIERVIQRRRPIVNLGAGHGLYRLNTHILGAQGYVITNAGARRLLAFMARIILPFDHGLDRFWENGITPHVVYPFPVRERRELPSSIGRRDPARRYERGLAALWNRRLNRWRGSIAKRLYPLRRI